MPSFINFENVSKQYKLGAARGSLRDAVGSLPGRLARGRQAGESDSNSLWALQDVSFGVEAGEILGIVGANGAGKSTILKIISRITRPTQGNVTVDGRVTALIEVGAGFHPELTGRENVYLNGAILGLNRKEIGRKFDAIVQFAELERFIDTPVKRYSSGMYLRLGFSVATYLDPEVLLVDEVLAVGDASFQRKCFEVFDEFRRRGIPIVFVSHYLWAVRGICTRAIFLDEGRIQAEGDVGKVIDAYEKTTHRKKSTTKKNSQAEYRTSPVSGVEITSVELLNRAGQASDTFDQFGAMKVRILYHAFEPLDDLNIAFWISRSDGRGCAMARSAQNGVVFDHIEGEGAFEFVINPLQLNNNDYEITVAITNWPLLGLFDSAGPIRFRVTGVSPSVEIQDTIFFPMVEWYG